MAKLETGLDILTQNVQTLADTVRSNTTSMEEKLERITIAVTQAQGPRKTDWSIIISAVLLLMAIGSAAFWPLNQTSSNTKSDLRRTEDKFSEHLTLPMHPVGLSRVGALEEAISKHNQDLEYRLLSLDNKLQKETSLAMQIYEAKLADLDLRIQNEFDLKGEAVENRIRHIEDGIKFQQECDEQELRSWRLKAMNLHPRTE